MLNWRAGNGSSTYVGHGIFDRAREPHRSTRNDTFFCLSGGDIIITERMERMGRIERIERYDFLVSRRSQMHRRSWKIRDLCRSRGDLVLKILKIVSVIKF